MLVIFQHTWRRKWVLEIFGEAGVKGQLNRVLSNFTFTRGCGLIYARCLFKRLTECSGGRASIIKNAFLFLSFFQSIHLYPTIISFLSFYLSIHLYPTIISFLSFNLSIHLYPTIISFLSFYLSIFCVRKNLNIWRFPIKRGPFATLRIRRAHKWPFDLSQ